MAKTTYGKPARELLKDMLADLEIQPGQSFTAATAIDWFERNYPNLKARGIRAHLVQASTNDRSRLHHKSTDASDDLIFRIGPGVYRLYEPDSDPPPIHGAKGETAGPIPQPQVPIGLDEFLEQGKTVADVLTAAGYPAQDLRTDRHFTSSWGWEDGRHAYITVWLHDIQDPTGTPKWSIADPALRGELTTQQRHRAQRLFEILRKYDGKPVRVILQRAKPDPSQWASGKSEARGFDPEPWYIVAEGDSILLQRGSLPGKRDADVEGSPMPARAPQQALRDTRPEQAKFRQRVAGKTGHRCALTGAPSEICDAAHFPWCDWHRDNEACHGVLLRRDLHAALDCNLLSIDREGRVRVSEYLASASDAYLALHGRTVPV